MNRAPKDAQELWEEYQGAIFTIANSFHKTYPHYLEIDEKVTAVFEGMLNCVDSYREGRGVKFLSYAWVAGERAVMKAIQEERKQWYPGTFRAPGKYGSLVRTKYNFQEPERNDGDDSKDMVSYATYKSGGYNTQDPITAIEVRRAADALHKALPTGRKHVLKLLLNEWSFREMGEKVKHDKTKKKGITKQAMHVVISDAKKKAFGK